MADMDQVFGVPVAYEESISAVTATNSVDLGSRRVDKGESYVYAYNAGGLQIDPSYGVKLVTGCSGYSVAATALADVANPCVGIVKHATLTTATYGWVMTKGFSNLEAPADSTITGDYVAIALGVSGTFSPVYQTFTTDIIGQGTFTACGYALGADTASGGSFYGFINTGF
jgi:hypothetical protein